MQEKPPYTTKPGQYLAFIHYSTKIHRRAPAETDLQRYFGASPAAVHQMLLSLEAKGFIERVHGKARAIWVMLPRQALPALQEHCLTPVAADGRGRGDLYVGGCPGGGGRP
ncbi:MAG: LexA family protein [Candidatus Entotheonellia bacterium]